MTQLSREAQRLFVFARDQDRPDAAAQARIERALARRIALGVATGGLSAALTAAPAAAATSGAVASILGVAAKAALVGLATGGAVVGLTTLGLESVPERRSEASAPGVAAPAHERPRTVVLPQSDGIEAPERTAPSAAPRVAPPNAGRSTRDAAPVAPPAGASVELAASAAPGAELDAETQGLRAAQRALRNGDSAQALALLADQDTRYARGSLHQERAAARVLALCQSGRANEARVEARHFEARWPRSPLLAKIKRSCAAP
jgi:hypothetical protein